jgi:hypothetical protein
VAVENPRGWRIAKEKASKKIDAIVALAMACVPAMAHRGEIGSRSARGFNRAMHVSKEKIVPLQGAPVYIGQTLIDVPATVIAQQSNHGSIHVLAAFASEGMGLRRHVETIVTLAYRQRALGAEQSPAFCWARTRMSSSKTSSIFCRLSRTC